MVLAPQLLGFRYPPARWGSNLAASSSDGRAAGPERPAYAILNALDEFFLPAIAPVA